MSLFFFEEKEREPKESAIFSILCSSALCSYKFRDIRERTAESSCRYHITQKSSFIHKRNSSVSPSYLSTKETRDAADAADVDDGERHHHSLLREQNRVLDWRDDVVFNATCASGDDEDDDDDDEKKKKKERNANERRERRRKWVRLARRPDSEEVFASSAERESRLLLHRRVADIESFDFHHSETFSPRGWERYRSERTHEL